MSYAARLIDEGVLDQAGWDRIDAEELAAVDDAVAFAEASPFPEAREALEHLFADTTDGDTR